MVVEATEWCQVCHRYLSFPLQTLGKTSKMLPVMLWGAVILHKRYRWRVKTPDTASPHIFQGAPNPSHPILYPGGIPGDGRG